MISLFLTALTISLVLNLIAIIIRATIYGSSNKRERSIYSFGVIAGHFILLAMLIILKQLGWGL